MKYNIHQSFAFLTSITADALEKRLTQNLKTANLPITSEQFKILVWLWEQDSRSQQELACLTQRDKGAIARILAILERKGLIIKKEDIKDRRVKLVCLTQNSNELKEVAYQVILDTIDEALIGIKPSDLIVGKTVLQQIIANLTDCK
ncbi:MAG: MarR family winged helix-turn-helix transcriptional regulator [Chitinophagales bacterium]